MKKFTLFLFGISVFLIFVFFSYLVHKNLFTEFDFNNTIRLQDHISRRFDDGFSLLSDIGKFEIMTIFLALLLLSQRKLRGIILLGLYFLFHMFEIYGKLFVNHRPPPEFMLRTTRILNFPQFHIRAENSYPSGHAARAAFVSIVIGFFLWRTKRISPITKLTILGFVITYDVFMLISRVYLGEHWTSDVAGGVLLGLATAFMGLAFFP